MATSLRSVVSLRTPGGHNCLTVRDSILTQSQCSRGLSRRREGRRTGNVFYWNGRARGAHPISHDRRQDRAARPAGSLARVSKRAGNHTLLPAPRMLGWASHARESVEPVTLSLALPTLPRLGVGTGDERREPSAQAEPTCRTRQQQQPPATVLAAGTVRSAGIIVLRRRHPASRDGARPARQPALAPADGPSMWPAGPRQSCLARSSAARLDIDSQTIIQRKS